MSAKNPFADNPWTGSKATAHTGPRYGNAYEDDTNLGGDAWMTQPSGDAVPQSMPSPSDYQWKDSSKTEYPDTQHEGGAWGASQTPDPFQDAYQYSGTPYANTGNESQDAYQYSGTRYGTKPTTGNAYASIAMDEEDQSPAVGKKQPNRDEIEAALPPPWKPHTPSRWRVLLRGGQLVAGIGHLGFAAGASPFSNHPVPFDNKSCFYFLFAVAIVSIIWSLFHLGHYLYRRFSHGKKLNRPFMLAIDGALCIMWGVAIIIEIAKFGCSPGGYDGWCDFYNVSIFWGMLAFVLYILAVGWDFIGACRPQKR